MREVTICYGRTETSPVSFQSHADDPIDKRISTAGRVHPDVQVKIVGGEGKVVPRGTPGPLSTRGCSVTHSYRDGPVRSTGVLNDHGCFNAAGCVTDVVIGGGENVYPREFEAVLCQRPIVSASPTTSTLRRGVRSFACAKAGAPRSRGSSTAAVDRLRITRCFAASVSCRNFP